MSLKIPHTTCTLCVVGEPSTQIPMSKRTQVTISIYLHYGSPIAIGMPTRQDSVWPSCNSRSWIVGVSTIECRPSFYMRSSLPAIRLCQAQQAQHRLKQLLALASSIGQVTSVIPVVQCISSIAQSITNPTAHCMLMTVSTGMLPRPLLRGPRRRTVPNAPPYCS